MKNVETCTVFFKEQVHSWRFILQFEWDTTDVNLLSYKHTIRAATKDPFHYQLIWWLFSKLTVYKMSPIYWKNPRWHFKMSCVIQQTKDWSEKEKSNKSSHWRMWKMLPVFVWNSCWLNFCQSHNWYIHLLLKLSKQFPILSAPFTLKAVHSANVLCQTFHFASFLAPNKAWFPALLLLILANVSPIFTPYCHQNQFPVRYDHI